MNPYQHLAKDPVLKRLIKEHGELILPTEKQYFRVLCRAIISQQISNAAAAAVTRRFEALFVGIPTAKKAQETKPALIKSAGLSQKKVEYIKDLAEHFLSKKITPRSFHSMSDEEIIEELIDVRGIGRWTAEMFIMFSLGREDVFSYGDIGLLNNIYKFYFAGEKVPKKELEPVVNQWAPYRSIASLYLWKATDDKDSPW